MAHDDQEQEPGSPWVAVRQQRSRSRSSAVLTNAIAEHGLVTVVAWVLMGISAVMAVYGYFSGAGTADVSKQVNRLAGISIGALAFMGTGAALLLSHHYRSTLDAMADVRDELLRESGSAVGEQ